MMVLNKEGQKLSRVFIIVFIIFSTAILAAGIIFYSFLYNRATEDRISELKSIRQLKINQITTWRNERASEAAFFFNNDHFLMHAYDYFNNPTEEKSGKLNTWFATIKDNHDYSSIMILSLDGEEIYRIGSRETAEYDLEKIKKTVTMKNYWVDDLNLDEKTGWIYLDTYTPLIIPGKENQIFGILVFRIDPYVDFYPKLRDWPVKNKTAEAVLVKQERDEILYLSDLRFRDNAALRFTLPLSRTDIPAVRAILGQTGIIRGKDYRDIEVLTSVGRVPDTDWILVTKIDESEVYDSIYLYSALLGVLILSLLIATGATLTLFARRKEYSAIQQLYRIEQEKLAIKEHYEKLVKHANDIILFMDYEGRIIDVNEKAVEAYGYTREELLSKTISDLRAPEVTDKIKKLLETSGNDGLVYESIHIMKNGEPFNVEVSFGIITINENKFIQNIIRDISDRKANEAKIDRLNRVYDLITQVNGAVINENDPLSLYHKICKIAVNRGKFDAAGFGIINKNNRIDIKISEGAKEDFLDITVPGGVDYKGEQLNAEECFVVNDLKMSQFPKDWKDEAARRGYRSAGYFPILSEEENIEALIFYSAEKDFFDEEEIRLLDELTNSISYAIEIMKRDKEQKALKEGLLINEINLKTLAASIPDTLIYIYDKDLNIIIAEGGRIAQVKTGKEIRGEKISGIFRGESDLSQKFQGAFNGLTFNEELRRGGKILSVQIHPVKKNNEEIYAGLVLIQDITSRKTDSQNLKKSEAMLKAFFNLNNVYMTLVELRENNIYFIMPNKKFIELYSSDSKDISGKSLRELAGEDIHNYWIDIYRNINKFRRPVSIEFSIEKEGKTRWLMAEISPAENDENTNPRFSYAAFDISERKLRT
jgi:PAS domain S-box-containing protein